MIEIPLFQRLERAVKLIARHPYYPGKQDALDDCLEDLEERFRAGSLTSEQKTTLVALLNSDDALEDADAEHSSRAGRAR